MLLFAPTALGRVRNAAASVVNGVRSMFGYDATRAKGRRKAPTGTLLSEDGELTPEERRKLVSSARDIQRNFSIAGWMVRKHLDYVSTFKFQSKSGNAEIDKRIESLVSVWSQKENCDVAGRHSLDSMIRLLEARRTIDGDAFLMKLQDGRLQAIEGDRVRTPYGGVPGRTAADFLHGVRCADGGAALEFCVCRRGKLSDFSSMNGTFIFERIVPASNMWQHAYFDRFDQVRGIAPMAPAINTLRDTYEGLDYALAKLKVSQLFALAVYREKDEPIGESKDGEGEGEGAAESSKPLVDFGSGPQFLDLDKDDKAEFLESATPSMETQQFASTMIGVALKGLDLPYSFYAENFTNFSGQRQAWIQYDLSARSKRRGNIELLDNIIRWRLRLWMEDGTLPEMDLTIPFWRWTSVGVPWIDPLKEVQADVQALEACLTSRSRILKEQGEDFEEIAHEQAWEMALLTKLRLPTSTTPQAAQSEPVDEEVLDRAYSAFLAELSLSPVDEGTLDRAKSAFMAELPSSRRSGNRKATQEAPANAA